jgi:peptidoglycan-associated lipoprotein
MKYTLSAIAGISLLFMAGCSSKSAVEPAAAPPPPPPSSAPAVAPLGDIFFEFDKSELSTASQDQLKQNSAWMAANSKNVTIEGHCDERGTNEYNMALGERRAISAKEYLVILGVQGSRLKTVSYGEERAFDSGHDEAAWAQNRRDHFVAE